MRALPALLLAPALAAAGCSIPDTSYDPSPDAAGVQAGFNTNLPPTKIQVTEGDALPYNVSLAAPPAGTVEVKLESTDTAKVTISPPLLTFHPDDYNRPQIVRVAGVEDSNLVAENAAIRLTSDDVPTLDRPVDVVDDDTQRFMLEPAQLAFTEGETASFTVRPEFQPTSDLAVDISSSLPNKVYPEPRHLVFTADDYTTPQPIVLTADHDEDNGEDVATIRITPVQDNVVEASLVATIADATHIETFGWKPPLPQPQAYDLVAGHAQARRVHISHPGQLRRLGFRARAGGVRIQIALYTEVINGVQRGPGRAVSVAPIMGINGADDYEVAASGNVIEGDYWLVIATDITTPLEGNFAASVPSCEALMAFSAGLPTDIFPSHDVFCGIDDAAIAVWLVIEAQN